MFQVPDENRKAFCNAIRRAAKAQLVLWDALSLAEGFIVDRDGDEGGEIESDDLGLLSEELAHPEDADDLDDGTILEWFKSVQPDENDDE